MIVLLGWFVFCFSFLTSHFCLCIVHVGYDEKVSWLIYVL